MTKYTSDHLVEVEWLANNLNRSDVKVVDATWYMPGTLENAFEQYETSRIPGSVFFDIDEISDKSSDLPHMLPSPNQFAEAVGSLGIGQDHHVVVYDRVGIFSSPRLWWTFRAMGHDKVSVLNGGLKKWLALGYPEETTSPSPVKAENYIARLQPDLVIGYGQLHSLLEHNNNTSIIDARPEGRFLGIDEEPRPGLRKGHMPGAINLPFGVLLSEDGTIKSPEEVKQILSQKRISLQNKIITTCGSGITASVLALVFALSGNEEVSVYDGSWSEWGAKLNAPIEVN